MIQPIQIKTYLSNNLEAIKKIPIISLLPKNSQETKSWFVL